MASWKLFLDDERHPITDDWVVCRSSVAAQAQILAFGMPMEIAFDHDLGGDDTSVLLIKWIIDRYLDGDLDVPVDLTYTIHSQNPTGAANIKGLLDGFLRHIGEGK